MGKKALPKTLMEMCGQMFQDNPREMGIKKLTITIWGDDDLQWMGAMDHVCSLRSLICILALVVEFGRGDINGFALLHAEW